MLFHAENLFSKLRALALLAAGCAVEDMMQGLFEAAGCPKELTAESFEKALVGGGKVLLEDLQKTTCDREAMKLVQDAYNALALQPEMVLALFLLGRAIHDMSLIINVRRPQGHEEYASLGYAQIGDTGLWGRLTVIDTDIKPAHRIPKYAKTLREYVQHHHVQAMLLEMMAGKTLDDALETVRETFQDG